MRQVILHLFSWTILAQTVSFHVLIYLHVIHPGSPVINGNAVSGNITDISDYLVQFLIISYQVHSKTKPKKILTRIFKSFPR